MFLAIFALKLTRPVSQEDPQRTVQTFIDLVQRHEQAFYTFVHNVHTKGQGLFDSLMGWIELFLGYARTGLETPLDLEVLLPAGGAERAAIMAEVDAVAQYHYKLKVAHEEKVRRRFASAGMDQAAVEEAQLVDSVMQSLSLGASTVGAAEEVADEESEEDELDDGDGDSDTASVVSAASGRSSLQNAAGRRSVAVKAHARDKSNGSDAPPPPPPKDGGAGHGGHGAGAGAGGNPLPVPPKQGQSAAPAATHRHRRRRRKVRPALEPPKTPHLDELRPLFVEAVKPLLKVRPIKA